MFTGLVEALGSVEDLTLAGAGRRLTLRVPPDFAAEATVGESVAVSGVCLTVVVIGPGRLAFDLAEETVGVTTLGTLRPADPVNLERPLRLGARLGGHLVLGHVDGVGRVCGVAAEGAGRRLTIELPSALRPLLIPKGSVAVDGVSVTVAGAGTISAARVSLGAVAERVLLVPAAAQAIVGSTLDRPAQERLEAAARAACRPIDDKRGTREFRIEIAGVLARRAALIALDRARTN